MQIEAADATVMADVAHRWGCPPVDIIQRADFTKALATGFRKKSVKSLRNSGHEEAVPVEDSEPVLHKLEGSWWNINRPHL